MILADTLGAAAEVGTIVGTLVVVGGIVLGVGKFVIDYRIRQHGYVPHKDVQTIKANTEQLRPNGGSHVADGVARTEALLKAFKDEVLHRLDRNDQTLHDLTAKVDQVQSQGDRLRGEYDEHVRQQRSQP